MVQNWKTSHYEEAYKIDVNISFICLETYISGSVFFSLFVLTSDPQKSSH